MKYYIDTEFIEYPCTIDLISIGIVCQDGGEYYAVSRDYNYKKASTWVKENVIHPIYEQDVYSGKRYRLKYNNFHKTTGRSRNHIKEEIIDFIGEDTPEFWGYYADYDWVAFCWLFGTMMDLPKGYPMYCRDLKQLADEVGKPKFAKPEGEHNAIADARWNEQFHNYLMKD